VGQGSYYYCYRLDGDSATTDMAAAAVLVIRRNKVDCCYSAGKNGTVVAATDHTRRPDDYCYDDGRENAMVVVVDHMEELADGDNILLLHHPRNGREGEDWAALRPRMTWMNQLADDDDDAGNRVVVEDTNYSKDDAVDAGHTNDEDYAEAEAFPQATEEHVHPVPAPHHHPQEEDDYSDDDGDDDADCDEKVGVAEVVVGHWKVVPRSQENGRPPVDLWKGQASKETRVLKSRLSCVVSAVVVVAAAVETAGARNWYAWLDFAALNHSKVEESTRLAKLALVPMMV